MLNMYMAYPEGGMSECAILIFAHTSREARNLSFGDLSNMADCEFIDVRAERIWDNPPHLLAASDQKKYKNSEPHVIDNPPGCSDCCMWGEDFIIEENGKCSMCNEAYLERTDE